MGADLTTSKLNNYFRDSYNKSSLLWQYDLSWWVDIAPKLVDGMVKPAIIMGLMDGNRRNFVLNMAMMRDKHNKHLDYTVNMGADSDIDAVKYEPYEDEENNREEIVNYYIRKDLEFRKYLQDAIDKDEKIECSL